MATVVTEPVETTEAPAKPEKVKPVTDIRDTIPLAVKGGTTASPVWTIDGKTYEFVRPVSKAGLDKNGAKIQLGKRIFAKYVASKTKAGADLLFVGVFKEVEVKAKVKDKAAPAAAE